MTQQKLESPEELLHYQIRSALMMEQHSLEALEELEAAARDSKVKKLFSHHSDETREQIANLEKVFTLLEYDQSTAPSPATTGIKTQAAALLDKADPKLHNQVAVMSALGNEHFEISAYTGMVLLPKSLKATDAAKLLQENLDQERHTSEELLSLLKELTL